jgi:four helix bundle protein
MTQTIPVPDPGADPGASPFLDCERLDCFRVAVEFQTLAAGFGTLRRLGALRDQLDRASVSIVLNIAEGAGRRTPADKAHFYVIARGSATECAAVLELLSARALLTPETHRHRLRHPSRALPPIDEPGQHLDNANQEAASYYRDTLRAWVRAAAQSVPGQP